MEYNYQIFIEYDGTNYVGWQYQKNGISIQEILEKKIKKVSKEKIKIIGAGRTDAGVHAKQQSANFILKKRIHNLQTFLNSVNFFLKDYSISIISIKKRSLKFHSRFDALERVYEYIITNRNSSLALNKNRSWLVKKKIDIKLLKKGANILIGKHDFSTFRASSCSAKSPIKKINYIKILKKNDNILIEFSSQSFLQNQVRSMVGCLKNLACKSLNVKEFKKVFTSKDRRLCSPPAPACGLYLKKVKY